MTTIAVVIPFYQRTPGILARSLASVFAQDLPAHTRVKVVIVDDQSPLPLAAELAAIAVPDAVEIVALARPNGGPGAARNTALDSLSPATCDFVAFLDSDDIWQPRHLAEGLAALAEDADFYFCDHERWNNPVSWFAESTAVTGWLQGVDGMAAPCPDSPDLFELSAGRALEAFLIDYMAQTSTVIYRFAGLAETRFDVTLRYAGEDHMFWLDLARHARTVRFSRNLNVRTDEGVNMYAAALASWDHPDAARRIGFNLLFLARANRRFGAVAHTLPQMRARFWFFQKEFAWVWGRKVLMTRSVDLEAIRALVSERRSLALTLPIAFLAAALRRPLGTA